MIQMDFPNLRKLPGDRIGACHIAFLIYNDVFRRPLGQRGKEIHPHMASGTIHQLSTAIHGKGAIPCQESLSVFPFHSKKAFPLDRQIKRSGSFLRYSVVKPVLYGLYPASGADLHRLSCGLPCYGGAFVPQPVIHQVFKLHLHGLISIGLRIGNIMRNGIHFVLNAVQAGPSGLQYPAVHSNRLPFSICLQKRKIPRLHPPIHFYSFPISLTAFPRVSSIAWATFWLDSKFREISIIRTNSARESTLDPSRKPCFSS